MYLASLSPQKRLLLEAIEYTSIKLKKAKIYKEPFEHYVIKDFLHPKIFENIHALSKNEKDLLRPKPRQEKRKIINITGLDPNSQKLATQSSIVAKFFQSLELKVQFTDLMRENINKDSWDQRVYHYFRQSP